MLRLQFRPDTFNTVNKATGNRGQPCLRRQRTDKSVPKEAQTKGFDMEIGQYIMIDPDEVAAAIPESKLMKPVIGRGITPVKGR